MSLISTGSISLGSTFKDLKRASDPGGRRYRCLLTAASSFLPRGLQFCRKNRLLLSQPVSLIPVRNNSLKCIAGVNDTAEKLFTGVNNTADKTVEPLSFYLCLEIIVWEKLVLKCILQPNSF